MTSSSPDAGAFARLRAVASACVAPLENWRLVVRHAWSVRFLVLATALDAAQTGVSFFSGSELVRPGTLAGLNMALALAALWARLVTQEKLSVPSSGGEA